MQFKAPLMMSTTATCTTTANLGQPASINVIPNDKLYISEPPPSWFGNGANPKDDPSWTNENWLKSRFHFSFAEYRNWDNSDFGVLRVMNDDLVQPHRGFGTHPHGNMEIVTYVVDGELSHEDTMGTNESLGRGSVQFMTAGTGIQHSEFNHGDKPLRFIQTWIKPSQSGLIPNYGSYCGDKGKEDRFNKIQHLVSGTQSTEKGPVQVEQTVDGYACEMELGKTVVHNLPAKSQAYLLCIEGSITVNGKKLNRHDACEIVGDPSRPSELEIKATGTEETENGHLAHFLMFTMPLAPGSGRRDL
mmetsp:Transcript_17814/g.41683  ORF Transcript_17814/g.41683 Transcript_17814/m.41683 type:complete len:303 (-) Transcript_17814:122-1030(-)